jgi:raffinose/stachyose/melibiose transport system substrate-binding protein
MKKHLTILFGMLLTALTVSTSRADTTVRILHLQDNPKYLEVWKQIGADFEKQNAGVRIDWQFLENEAFKAKLPTTLQSKERPDLFYSWAGGVFFDQARAGVLKDITTFMQGEWADSLNGQTH